MADRNCSGFRGKHTFNCALPTRGGICDLPSRRLKTGRLLTGHWQNSSPSSRSPYLGATATDDLPRFGSAYLLRRIVISNRVDFGRRVSDRVRARQTADDVRGPPILFFVRLTITVPRDAKFIANTALPSLGASIMDCVTVTVTVAPW
jgi:hypothetical protein